MLSIIFLCLSIICVTKLLSVFVWLTTLGLFNLAGEGVCIVSKLWKAKRRRSLLLDGHCNSKTLCSGLLNPPVSVNLSRCLSICLPNCPVLSVYPSVFVSYLFLNTKNVSHSWSLSVSQYIYLYILCWISSFFLQIFFVIHFFIIISPLYCLRACLSIKALGALHYWKIKWLQCQDIDS